MSVGGSERTTAPAASVTSYARNRFVPKLDSKPDRPTKCGSVTCLLIMTRVVTRSASTVAPRNVNYCSQHPWQTGKRKRAIKQYGKGEHMVIVHAQRKAHTRRTSLECFTGVQIQYSTSSSTRPLSSPLLQTLRPCSHRPPKHTNTQLRSSPSATSLSPSHPYHHPP